MASPFHLPVTAAQIGTYFVGQYYHVLQSQPDVVHQFYSDASTMLRIDGHTRNTATAMLQIHTLIMSFTYTGIEIKTAHSLESWNGGVLVLVSGSVLLKGFNDKRKFVQTFFLAPQEKGYYVHNDIFHFIDDEPIHHNPLAYLAQTNLDTKLNAATTIRDQALNYMLGGDTHAREFMAPAAVEENGQVDSFSFQEQRLQKVPKDENILEDNYAVQSNGSLQSSVHAVQERRSSPIDEPIDEPPKHTYASIVVKGPSVPSQSPVTKKMSPALEWNSVPEPSTQQSFSPTNVEGSGHDATEDISFVDDEVEIKSVYVRNVPSTASASEIEEEFKKFGKIKYDGVAIRTRKDIDVCYAFVEFEDISGVHNAIKASTVEIAGQQVYIEGRRANRINAFRGGRGRGRGRGRADMGGNQTEGRGRISGVGNFGRRSRQNGNENDHRGNGNYHRGHPSNRQGRAYSTSRQAQPSRNGYSQAE